MTTYEQGQYGTQQGTQYGTGVGTTAAGTMGAGQFGKVIVTLKSARNLNDKSWIGKSDPYCEVRIAGASISTHHVKGAGESATWDESFSFNNVSPDDTMELHVLDHNRLLKDAHMGEGSVSLRQVFEQSSQDIRVPLSTRSGTKDAGEVWITMRMEGGGMGQKGGYETTGMTTGTTTTTTTEERPAVCGQEFFTKTEDRPIVKEKVTYIQEHRPVEKEFVVETRATGVEREGGERTTEHLGTEERIVAETKPKAPCE